MKHQSSAPLIAIRVDASPVIGAGHVMRCLTLANTLTKRARILFLSCDMPAALLERIRYFGYECIAIPKSDNINMIIEALANKDINTIDILIIDHYGINSPWMKGMRAIVNKITVIDDLADRALDCDLLVNPGFGAESLRWNYEQLISPSCKMLLGSEFSIVAPVFRQLRAKAIERRRVTWPLSNILISTGFSDLGGAAVIACQTLKASKWSVTVAISSASTSFEPLCRIGNSYSNIIIKPDCNEMATEMLKADIMIGTPGTTSWERATLALPSVLVVSANNQRHTAASLKQAGASYILGEAADLKANELITALDQLAGDRDTYCTMSTAAAALCDGYGAERIANTLMKMLF